MTTIFSIIGIILLIIGGVVGVILIGGAVFFIWLMGSAKH